MSIWYSAHEDTMLEMIIQSPGKAAILAGVFKRMKDGFSNNLSVYGQLDNRPYTMTDAYAMAILNTWIHRGDLLFAKIHVGSVPASDAQVKENNQRLQQLPYPFEARFWGSTFRADGILKWYAPIECGFILPNGKERTETLSPCSIPLEVGYTGFTTTKGHLQEFGALARWPYDDKWITLIYLANGELLGSSLMARVLDDKSSGYMADRMDG